MKTNQHGVLICRVCNQNKERRSQVYRGARGDYVLGRAIHRKMVEGVKKLPQSTPFPAIPPVVRFKPTDLIYFPHILIVLKKGKI